MSHINMWAMIIAKYLSDNNVPAVAGDPQYDEIRKLAYKKVDVRG